MTATISEGQKLAAELESLLGGNDSCLLTQDQIMKVVTVLLSYEIIVMEKQKIIDRLIGNEEKRVDQLENYISDLKERIYSKKSELNELIAQCESMETKKRMLCFGGCFLYVGNCDRLNQLLDGGRVDSLLNDIIFSDWIEVRGSQKDRVGNNCIEYFVEYNGTISYSRSN